MSLAIKDITNAIEEFAPLSLQESWDNSGLQIGDVDRSLTSVMLCLDVTEDIVEEALRRECNLIVSHHPLFFRGVKQLTGATPVQRVAEAAIKSGISIYAAHTNLDNAPKGVSYEMARSVGLSSIEVLHKEDSDGAGTGVVGNIEPIPVLEFIRLLREEFNVRALRYSADTPKLVVRRVAMCGGSGAEFIAEAVKSGADAYVTGDIKYHDFTTWSADILLADIGHFESELCSRRLFERIIRQKFPECSIFMAETDRNPVAVSC